MWIVSIKDTDECQYAAQGELRTDEEMEALLLEMDEASDAGDETDEDDDAEYQQSSELPQVYS